MLTFRMITCTVLCLLLLAAGCGRQQQESHPLPATLTLAVGGENPEGYDPTLGWGSYGNPLFQSTLLKHDADLNIVPDLATAWELASDRLTWTITIRPDVRFADGSPLTARDVAYTFNTAAAAGGVLDLANLDRAVALDDTRVQLCLKQPDITFIHYLITLGIVPARLHGPGYGHNPVGSGPYRLVRWDEGQQLVVEANPYYYGVKPAFKRLIFLFCGEDTALAAARAGQVDVLAVPAGLATREIPGMRLHVVKSVDNRGLMFPCVPDIGTRTPQGLAKGNKVTADKAIRRAVNLAINRKILVDGVLEGFGRPAFGPVDDLPWDNPAVRFDDNKVQEAGILLTEAGWVDIDGDGVREKNGIKAEFTIAYNAADSLRQGLALAVADMLRPVGIRAVPRGESWDRIKNELVHSTVVVFGFGGHSPLEMYRLYHSTGPEPSYWNGGFYSNATVDRYLDRAKAAPSFADSIPLWQKAQWDGQTGFSAAGDAPWAWLVNLDHTYYIDLCLDVGRSQLEPHGHGWPITANINEWQWTCR